MSVAYNKQAHKIKMAGVHGDCGDAARAGHTRGAGAAAGAAGGFVAAKAPRPAPAQIPVATIARARTGTVAAFSPAIFIRESSTM